MLYKAEKKNSIMLKDKDIQVQSNQYFQIYRELDIFLMDSCLTMGRHLQGNDCTRKDRLTQWQTWVVCTSPLVMYKH